MSEGRLRRSFILALTASAACLACADGARAQFFPGFGAPQQINTPRGAIQLAPGWRVVNTPVRTGQGYRLAVRSDYGEQRDMVIGADGAIRATARPMMRIERPQRKLEAQKPKVKLAAVRGPGKPPSPSASPQQDVKPAAMSAPVPKGEASTPATNDISQKQREPGRMGPQAPGFAHGVPINPLD